MTAGHRHPEGQRARRNPRTWTPLDRVSERREEAHKHLRKRYRRLLAVKEWTKKDLAALGPNLRKRIRQHNEQRRVVLHRLEWPFDPEYDRRAFEKSGITDPYEQGLI